MVTGLTGSWLGTRRLVLGSAALAGAGIPEICSPLPNALEGRHPPVVITEVDNPITLVKPLLQPVGGLQILFGLLAGQSVNSDKMPEQLCPISAVAGKQNVFGIVAIFA